MNEFKKSLKVLITVISVLVLSGVLLALSTYSYSIKQRHDMLLEENTILRGRISVSVYKRLSYENKIWQLEKELNVLKYKYNED